MLVHASVTGYYDWSPAPPGTEITEADVSALRAKQMTDEAWHIRVDVERETHNDCNIPESAICDRMASLESLGRSQSREATVAELLTATYRHHLNPRNIVAIEVHDDGPNEEMYAADLARLGVTGERAESAMAMYMDGADVQAYLNVVFKTHKTKAPKAKVSKETP